jgi:hypothetical protein
MKIADMIKQGLKDNGYPNLKVASKALGISPEILRVVINKGHIPKDNTLSKIGKKLGLDNTTLILAAHLEKVPAEVKGYFLSPSPENTQYGKRVHPLSTEQCVYLEKIMSPEELQIVRKTRQVSDEAKTQIQGYVDYLYASKKQ